MTGIKDARKIKLGITLGAAVFSVGSLILPLFEERKEFKSAFIQAGIGVILGIVSWIIIDRWSKKAKK